MAASTYTLHNYWRSSCSYRVRIALEWKGVAYAYRSVNLSRNQQQDAAYSSLNPNHRVPALALGDGRVVAQSGAILEFLEEAHPDKPRLLPPLSDPFARAQVRNLCGIIGCDTQPFQMLSVQAKATETLPEGERDAAKLAWVSHWIARGLRAVEAELGGCAGVYSVGDSVTLADVYLLPQVYNARLASLDMAEFPAINKVVGKLEALPAFQRAHPDVQPDAIVS